MGKIFWENSLSSSDFATTYAAIRTKYSARRKYSACWFRRKKSTLRIEIWHWFFMEIIKNSSPLIYLNKKSKIFLSIWFISCNIEITVFSLLLGGGTCKRRRTTFANIDNQFWFVFGRASYSKKKTRLKTTAKLILNKNIKIFKIRKYTKQGISGVVYLCTNLLTESVVSFSKI